MKQFLAVAACCCGLLVLSLPVQAKDNIENITVTASRTPILVDDAGSAVTLITKQDIERQGALSLADLLRDVPGLSVSQQGGIGTFAQVRMRGAEANQVLVLIDGVEANDVSQGSEFNFTHVLATGIQRIEVVRGPQSALWGADALAGVINVITDPGAHAETSMHGTAETGSHNTARAALDMNWHGESGNLAFGASRFGTAGTNISRTGNEPDGYRNVTAHVSGHLDVLENSRLSFTLRG
ncbi:MAG TPA: TonB-dependent receptor plug domain-containing protein, partial [Pseudomonadales bacterium]|nr:TonB-dependent receptor plug domain-containing protein [Pseudomonadales bacterium]